MDEDKSPNSREPEGSLGDDLLNAMGIGWMRKKKADVRAATDDETIAAAYMECSEEEPKAGEVTNYEPIEIAEKVPAEEGLEELIAEESVETAELPDGEVWAAHVDEGETEETGEENAQELELPQVPTDHRKDLKRAAVFALFLAGFGTVTFFLPKLTSPRPPAKDVVATYNGKNVTEEEFRAFLKQEGVRTVEHMICSVHGYDHTKCSPEEPCEQHPVDTLEGYRQAVEMMAAEQIILDWAEKKGLTEREDVKHGLSDLVGDAGAMEVLNSVHQEEITPDSISMVEIQQYYEENKDKYPGKTVEDVTEEIRSVLLAKKDAEYIPEYIAKLKESAGLEFNAELLQVPEVTSQEIRAYYEANPMEFQTEDGTGSRAFEEVRQEISDTLTAQAMEKTYSLREGEALFSVHGRRYTLGDFYREFQELPEEYRKTFSTYEKKKELVEQLIARELLLEEQGDGSDTGEENHDMEELKIQYLSQVMHQEEVDQKLTEATEEEMTAFYEENKTAFRFPAKAKISFIWIGKTEDGKGKSRADEAKAQLDSGGDFSETAKQYSEDGSAGQGGVMEEWLYQGHFTAEIDNAIFSLNAGEISPVVESGSGYYIFQVREKEEESQMTFEESKDTIALYLKEKKHLELEQEMETGILKDADLVIYDSTLERMLKENKEEMKAEEESK